MAGARVRVTGPLLIRLSVVAGNLRVQRLMDGALTPGATVIDVGANIGYNTIYAAKRVGPSGRVIAIEPAADSLAVLEENVRRNALANVEIHACAAGRERESRQLFVRGAHSGVNSLFPTSIYAEVSSVEPVQVIPVDELVLGDVDLVKMDVEGGELEVLGGMTRLLRSVAIRLIVEWHPLLQEHAGYASDALPRFLLERGFRLQAASHWRTTPLERGNIESVADQLRRAGRPIELFAQR
jgi:FkbM family methyltransferase